GVVGVAVEGDESCGLQATQEGGERRGFEQQLVGEVALSAGTPFPEGEHHEILRVGQAERFEDRTAERDGAAGCRGERETELTVEGERVHGGGRHGSRILSARSNY